MSIILVEGIPGSGKSTMAASICTEAVARGVDAKWYREEAHDHPIHPLRKTSRGSGFASDCLRSARGFIAEAARGQTLHILEGSAFQSTVRFMMEDEHDGIKDYFREYEQAIAAEYPVLIYLRPEHCANHSRFIAAHRGEPWTSKVARYLERTRYCRSHQLTGVAGMHEFWDRYAMLCDTLVSMSGLPRITISVTPGDWDRHLSEALHFLESTGRLPLC